MEQGRGAKLKKSPESYSGLIWNGARAMELGLIDGYGSVRSVARDKHGIEELWDYSPKNPLSNLKDALGVYLGQGLAGALGVKPQGGGLAMEWGQ